MGFIMVLILFKGVGTVFIIVIGIGRYGFYHGLVFNEVQLLILLVGLMRNIQHLILFNGLLVWFLLMLKGVIIRM